MRLPLPRGAAEIHRSSLARGLSSPQQVLAGNQTSGETAVTPRRQVRRPHLYHGDRGRPRAHRMLTETSPLQDKLTGIFSLARYAPRR